MANRLFSLPPVIPNSMFALTPPAGANGSRSPCTDYPSTAGSTPKPRSCTFQTSPLSSSSSTPRQQRSYTPAQPAWSFAESRLLEACSDQNPPTPLIRPHSSPSNWAWPSVLRPVSDWPPGHCVALSPKCSVHAGPRLQASASLSRQRPSRLTLGQDDPT